MIPVLLEIKNFFSHKDSVIDFSEFNSALLIGNTEGDYNLSNGSGKSAIFESILWCLFNKARVAAMDDIILWGENSCDVIMTFRQSDTLYKVHRTRSRVSGQAGVSFAYLSDDDDWVDISGSTSRLTNQKIVSILKFNYKTFINSAYFRQNDISEFAESDPSRKKEILKSIIDLTKWDQYEKDTKLRLKGINSEADLLESKIQELDSDELELAKNISSIKELEFELSELSMKKVQNNETLDKMLSQYQKVKGSLDTGQWDKIISENLDIKKRASRIKTSIEASRSSIFNSKENLKPLTRQIEEISSNLNDIEFDNNIDEKLKKAQDSLISFRTRNSTASSLLDRLLKKEIKEGLCNICGQNISNSLHKKLAHNHNEEVESFNNEIIFTENKISEMKALVKKFESVKKDNKKAESYTSKLKSLNRELEINREALEKEEKILSDLNEDLSSLKLSHDSNLKILDSLKNDDFKKLHDEIEVVKSSRKSLELSIASKNQEFGILSEKIKNLTSKIEIMKSDKEKLVNVSKRRASYEKLSKLLGKNGVQTILLNAVIEDLEKTANNVLESICNEPLVILLETQRLGSDGVSVVDTLDLKVRKDGFTQNFKSLSGGEQFRISLSLRIALSEISSRHGGSSLEFLLLDEINSPLDRHGTENLFVNVVRSLGKKYKIMVITHNDSLKDKFENVIDVTKINGESSTLFTRK